ncbi:hypothetical protein Tco_0854092 [Tanacetum coccineum]
MVKGYLYPCLAILSHGLSKRANKILAFIRELGYPRDIKSLSDVKVDTLYQLGKHSEPSSPNVSVKNVDYVYLLWEDLVYQIENKVSKKNKDMYYPRFTKVIINTSCQKINQFLRRNKEDWPHGDSKTKVCSKIDQGKTDQAPTVSRLKTQSKVRWLNQEKKNSNMLKKSSDEDDDDEVSLSKDDDDNDDNKDDDNEQTESDNDGDDFVHPKFSAHDEEERQNEEDKEEEGLDLRVQTPSHFESTNDETYDEVTQGDNVEGEELDKEETNEEEKVNDLYRDVNVNLEGRDTEMMDALLANVQTTQVIEDTHVIIIVVTPEVQQQSSSVSSGFISNMLNPNPNTGIDSILNMNTESTFLVDVLVTTNVEMPPSSITTLPPPPIPLVQPHQQTPVPTPTIVPSTYLQNLPTFGSLFKFEDRVKALEDYFSQFKQTNLFVEAVSSLPGIVDTYLANKMNEAIKTVVQLQSDRLRDEAKAENKDIINKLNENIKKIIKKQVKVQVKEQVTKILPRIKKLVNEQLEAEVLICSSNEAKTSHKNLYKAFVDAYESDKDILASHGDTVTLKRRRDDEDEDEEPFAGSNRGSKRRRAGKEPELTSVPKEKTSKSTGMSKEGSKSHQKSTGKSAQPEEPIYADEDLEEPAHQEFDTGFTEDQSIDETTQHLDWFQKPTKPPTPDRDWNKTLPDKHGLVQP